ncbi:uncharacterized protein LOC115889799 [Sitophilus oryzae]|uniref:Uncharacterized protein LOC115889799 n=1 Tax=Sitophilus oryzae TaxID=7048 RepID=A0A6J2YP03_SITOR|nr:uncharacterized protein LOC115889799 [Sitophilus oryzae]
MLPKNTSVWWLSLYQYDLETHTTRQQYKRKDCPIKYKTDFHIILCNVKLCENYRGISVTTTVSRIYGKIVRNRIENEYQEIEAEEQAGFRAGRSTVDHLFTVTQVTSKKSNLNQELHLVFVDLQKAHDSVPLVRLLEAMENTSINVELIKAVKSYNQTKIKIKVGKKLTTGFNRTKSETRVLYITNTVQDLSRTSSQRLEAKM